MEYIEYLEELKGFIVKAEEYINFLKYMQQGIEDKGIKQEEHIIDYPKECFTWAEGITINAGFPFDIENKTTWVNLGEVRATEEQAEQAIRRNIRGNRLEALAHSIGGVYEFNPNDKNWFIIFDSFTLEAKADCNYGIMSAERVYMTEATAKKVVEILNSGTYKLNRKPEGN